MVGGEIGGLRTFDGPVDFFFELDTINLGSFSKTLMLV